MPGRLVRAMGFQGSVESFSLADVFQNLAMNQQTGTLRVHIPDGPERHLYFAAGQLKALSHGERLPLLLGNTLLGRGVLTEAQLQQALARQKGTGESLGLSLVQLGFLPQPQLDELLTHQIEEGTYELFAWDKAQFAFTEGPPPDGLFTEQTAGQGPGLPISNLIMEAARRVDEWERLRQQVPSFREIYVVEPAAQEAAGTGQLELDPVERRVLSLLNGQRDVEDLIEDAGLFRFEIIQAVAGFLQSSLIRPAAAGELEAAAQALGQAGQLRRQAKGLERLLSLGVDRPDLRRALAEALLETGEGEKAVIHLSVLAETELAANHEDEAVALYRRVLQTVPRHLPSRERLGALYLRRGQKREAYVQFHELLKAYQTAKQWGEARLACLHALESDPAQLDLYRDLIQIYLAENDRVSAAREAEGLGDLYASQGNSKAAADAYRQALQAAPGQTHLKRKLDDVMLTEEDRRARRRQHLVAFTGAAAFLALASVVGLREFRLAGEFKALRAKALPLVEAGLALEKDQRFGEALSQYEEAQKLYQTNDITHTWSFQGCARKAREDLDNLDDLREAAQERLNRQRQGGKEDSHLILERAIRCSQEDDIKAAQAALQKVLDNPFTQPQDREQAEKYKKDVDERVRKFKEGLAKLEEKSFASAEEEYRFKDDFYRNFRQVPDFDPGIEFPVRIITNADGVGILVDGKLKDVANSNGSTVVRYDRLQDHRIEFRKPGYRAAALHTQGLGPQATVVLERTPACVGDLGQRLAGSPYFDGQWVWAGTAEGDLIQLDPQTLKERWRFSPPSRGLEKEVYGDIVPYTTSAGKQVVLYATKGGDCVVVAPGQAQPLFPIVAAGEDQPLRAPAVIVRLSAFEDQAFFLLPVGKRLKAVQAEMQGTLWAGGAAQEIPAFVTSTPAVVDLPDRKLVVAGADDGALYAWNLRSGQLEHSWPGRGAAIRTAPVCSGNLLAAGSADGLLYFLNPRGGVAGPPLTLKGGVTAPLLLQRRTLFVGTSTADGLYAVDLDRQTVQFAWTGEQLQGGLTTAPALAGNRLYLGTDAGRFYALDRTERAAQFGWKYAEVGTARLAGPPVVAGPPAVPGRRIIFVCANGKVFAFDE